MSLKSFVLAALTFMAASWIGIEPARAGDFDHPIAFKIPSQSLSSALMEFAEQASIQVLTASSDLEGLQSRGVQGRYTAGAALRALLEGTGFSFKRVGAGTVTIARDDRVGADDASGSEVQDGLQLAQVHDSEKTSTAVADKQPDTASQQQTPEAITEVVVTAQKRSESIQDVPMSITAVDKNLIDKKHLVGMDDYLRTLPSVNIVDRGAGQNAVVVRGVSSDPINADAGVGVYFGEVPTTGLGIAGNNTPNSADLKLVDIERVEVLRGPQGTLYGAGSLAGTVRVIPSAPNFDGVQGRVSTSYSQTSGKGGDNASFQGHINLPLIADKLAVRAVAYRFENSGFVERAGLASAPPHLVDAVNQYGAVLATGEAGSDSYQGYRFAARYRAAENLNVTLTYTHQDIEQDGFNGTDMTLPARYQQAALRLRPDGSLEEYLEHTVDLANLVFEYTAPIGALTASMSRSQSRSKQNSDTTALFALPIYYLLNDKVDVTTWEARFASSLPGPWQFFVGSYYEDFGRDWTADFDWIGTPALDPFGSARTIYNVAQPSKQFALFGETSYEVVSGLTATVGARYFRYNQNGRYERGSGPINGGDSFSPFDNKGSGSTFKASLRYALNPENTLYALWAQGFRLGKPQGALPAAACDVNGDGLVDGLGVAAPAALDADELDNYEIGWKSLMLDRRVRVNASVYTIDWKGIPVSITDPSCFYPVTFNAGKAVSRGAELEVSVGLVEGLQLDVAGSYGTAELAQDAPGLGTDGDDLPGSPDVNYSLGLQYSFQLAGHSSFVRADFSHVGSFLSGVASSNSDCALNVAGCADAGDYDDVSAALGTNFGKLRVEVYGRNLSDSRGRTWASSAPGNGTYLLRPRTVGLTLGYEF